MEKFKEKAASFGVSLTGVLIGIMFILFILVMPIFLSIFVFSFGWVGTSFSLMGFYLFLYYLHWADNYYVKKYSLKEPE